MGFLKKSYLLIQIQNQPFFHRCLQNSKFAAKNVVFAYIRHMLGLEVAKTNHILNQRPKFIKIRNFMQKEKKLNLGLKTLFREFWVSLLEKTLSNFSKCKVSFKKKVNKIKTKMPYLGILKLEFFFSIYNLHVFKQKIYSHQVLVHLDVPRIPVKEPLQNT